jgi:hypothetical protein
MNNKQSNPIQIFKAGRHTAMDGTTLTFSTADLLATAQAYNADSFAAPLVVGHPQTDHPAYGWVKSLEVNDGVLSATPHQVDPQFAEMVKAGRFKKVSASFYLPAAANNPDPGRYYLRHVGFLGAAAPAVQGLKPAQFSASEAGVVTVEFADWGVHSIGQIFRNIREFIIAKYDQETADQVVPEYHVADIQDLARQPDPIEPIESAYTEPQPTPTEERSMTPEEIAAKEAALQQRETTLQTEEAAFAQRNQEIQDQERTAHSQRCAEFVAGLAGEGRILPKDQPAWTAILDHIGQPGTTELSFAEGDTTVKQDLAATVQALLTHAHVIQSSPGRRPCPHQRRTRLSPCGPCRPYPLSTGWGFPLRWADFGVRQGEF